MIYSSINNKKFNYLIQKNKINFIFSYNKFIKEFYKVNLYSFYFYDIFSQNFEILLSLNNNHYLKKIINYKFYSVKFMINILKFIFIKKLKFYMYILKKYKYKIFLKNKNLNFYLKLNNSINNKKIIFFNIKKLTFGFKYNTVFISGNFNNYKKLVISFLTKKLLIKKIKNKKLKILNEFKIFKKKINN